MRDDPWSQTRPSSLCVCCFACCTAWSAGCVLASSRLAIPSELQRLKRGNGTHDGRSMPEASVTETSFAPHRRSMLSYRTASVVQQAAIGQRGQPLRRASVRAMASSGTTHALFCPERSCVYGHDSPASQTGPRKEVVRTDKAPAAVGPYSQVRLTPSRRYAKPAQCRQQSRSVLMALVALHQ